jgi:glycosyltransferase involved in cell wall biosynthesis
MSFPILVMTRNEGENLERCIHSILDTVLIDVKVYIVDNASTDINHLAILDKLCLMDKVHVVRNMHNRWVLGLNETISKIKKYHGGKYFLLTDGDIDFSQCMPGQCWLTFLKNQMDNKPIIGKLGISLSWEYLQKNDVLNHILKQEEKLYSESKKIDQLYISQVDTTATIFRWDWSVEKSSHLYPLHINYLRPELYSCRTSRDVCVEHLGWEGYHSGLLSKQHINEKVKCFTIVGGHLKKDILNQASKKIRLFHYLFATPFKRVWAIRRYWHVNKYCLLKSRSGFDGQTSK